MEPVENLGASLCSNFKQILTINIYVLVFSDRVTDALTTA